MTWIEFYERKGENMIYCQKCRAECSTDSDFCWRCGAIIPVYSKDSYKKPTPFPLESVVIPLLIVVAVCVVVIMVFTGGKGSYEGVICDVECPGTTLWKMKC